MKEQSGVPVVKTRSNKYIYSEKKGGDAVPKGLIGPSSAVTVQVEGIYAKAILYTGSQMTLLYRSYYNRYQPVTHH